jgi:Outer membrane protein beta-barrel domain
MSIPSWKSPLRRVSFLSTAALLAASFAGAQSAPSPSSAASTSFSPSTESSSLQNMAALDPDASSPDASSPDASSPDALSIDASPVPSAPTPSASAGSGAAGRAAGQDYGGGSGWKHYVGSRLAFEAGGGFNAPESSSVTYGGNFTIGGGLSFNSHLSALIEYQFLQDKLPGALIAEAEAQGGYARIWSFGIAPVIDLMPKSKNDVYITGGGGFYRKVTNFTDPEEICEVYYYEECGTENQVVGHFSSNQGGFNVGGGFQHRLGGMYGDSRAKLFAEVRYLDVLSPAVVGQSANGLAPTTVAADTKLIPITLGVRF